MTPSADCRQTVADPVPLLQELQREYADDVLSAACIITTLPTGDTALNPILVGSGALVFAVRETRNRKIVNLCTASALLSGEATTCDVLVIPAEPPSEEFWSHDALGTWFPADGALLHSFGVPFVLLAGPAMSPKALRGGWKPRIPIVPGCRPGGSAVGSSTEVAPAPQNSTAPHPELGGPIAEPEAALPTGPVNPHLTLLGFSLFDLTCTQPAALQDWVANCRVAKSRDNEVDAPSVIVVDDHDLQVLREFAGDDNLMALAQEEFYELLLTSSIALEDVCEAGVPAPASATPGAADTDQVAPDATQAPRKAVHATRQSPPSTVADAERALETFLDTPDEFFRIPAAHREYARALRAELADFASEAERSRDPIRRELYRMAGQITYEMQLAVPYIGHPQRVRHSDLAIDLGNLSPAQYVELRRQQILKVFSQIAGQRRRRR